MNRIQTAVVLMLLLLVTRMFCIAPTEAQKQISVDSWYLAPKNKEGWKELKPQRSYRVKPAFVPSCTGDLKNVRFKKIEWAEAQLIVGNAMDETKGYTPYLARGLMINDGTGGFQIQQKGGAIWVSHIGLGQFRSWTKQPIVVILRNSPAQVYTTASTAS